MTREPLPTPAAALPATASPAALALGGVAFSALWSSAFIAGKVGLQVTGPLTLLALRFLLAGTVLALGLALAGRRLRVSPVALLAGLLCNAVYLGLAYEGLRTVPAAATAIIVCTTPLLVLLLGAGRDPQPLGWRGGLGMLLAFGAVLLIMGQRLRLEGLDLNGVGLIVAGTLALAVGTRLNRRVAGREDPWQVACGQLLAGGLALLPLALGLEGLQLQWGPAFWGSVLYQAGPVSVGTTLLMLWLVRQGGASRAASFHLLSPFFSLGLAAAWLGERLFLWDALGLLPLVAGLALVLRRR